jgi:hypothetical protein
MLCVICAECHLCCVTFKPFMLSVTMLNVVMLSEVMLSVVAPEVDPFQDHINYVWLKTFYSLN